MDSEMEETGVSTHKGELMRELKVLGIKPKQK